MELDLGAPRIVGELHKIGIEVAKSTVEKYRPKVRKPPSPTWKAFLKNHVKDLVSCDFFIVPTVTHKVLFVFVILAHERRRIVHFNMTEHPTAQLRSGPPSRSLKRFRGMRPRAISFGIAIRFTARRFQSELATWASKR